MKDLPWDILIFGGFILPWIVFAITLTWDTSSKNHNDRRHY